MRRRDRAWRSCLCVARPSGTDPEYLRKVGAQIYGGEVAAELLDGHAAVVNAGDFRGYLYQMMAVAGWTSFPWLHRIKTPTLVMMGDDDPLVPVINGKLLTRRLPNADLEIINGGHLFMLTKAERIADRVQKFVLEHGCT